MQMMVLRLRGGGEGGLGVEGSGGGAEIQRKQIPLVFLLTLWGEEPSILTFQLTLYLFHRPPERADGDPQNMTFDPPDHFGLSNNGTFF